MFNEEYDKSEVDILLFQIEEEMQLIEQDFLEAMFDQLLAEEEEKESYYGPPDGMPNQNASNKSGFSMQLPQVCMNLTNSI